MVKSKCHLRRFLDQFMGSSEMWVACQTLNYVGGGIRLKKLNFNLRDCVGHQNWSGYVSINPQHAVIGFTMQNRFYFLKIPNFQRLFQELLNQYQACWYLFECISNKFTKW